MIDKERGRVSSLIEKAQKFIKDDSAMIDIMSSFVL